MMLDTIKSAIIDMRFPPERHQIKVITLMREWDNSLHSSEDLNSSKAVLHLFLRLFKLFLSHLSPFWAWLTFNRFWSYKIVPWPWTNPSSTSHSHHQSVIQHKWENIWDSIWRWEICNSNTLHMSDDIMFDLVGDTIRQSNQQPLFPLFKSWLIKQPNHAKSHSFRPSTRQVRDL